jgi:trk system potassium uptake protein TrkA
VRIIVLGCGRLGALVATRLDQRGHQVTVISQNQDDFARLPPSFGGNVGVGNGIDVDVLRANGVDGADAFVALTDGDNTNVMASQIAKFVLGVPRAISQIKDPLREETYRSLGIQTICPTRLGAERIGDWITGSAGLW